MVTPYDEDPGFVPSPPAPPPLPPPPPQPFASYNDYLGIVAQWGFPPTDVGGRQLIQQYVSQFGGIAGGSLAGFWKYMVQIYGRPPYGAGGPPGGFGGGGGGGGGASVSLVYTNLAKQYGVNLTGSQLSTLVQGQVSLSEFQSRLEAIKRVQEHKISFDQFHAEAIAEKLIGPNQAFGFKDRVAFVLGLAPKKFYDLWERASARSAATRAGYTIGGVGDLGLSRQEVIAFVNSLPGTQQEADVQPIFAQAAQLALSNASWSRYKGYGLSRTDFLDIAAGTGSAEKIASLQRAISELEEFSQIRQPLQLRGIAGQGGLVG